MHGLVYTSLGPEANTYLHYYYLIPSSYYTGLLIFFFYLVNVCLSSVCNHTHRAISSVQFRSRPCWVNSKLQIHRLNLVTTLADDVPVT